MEEKVHLLAAKFYFEIAEQKDGEYEKEADTEVERNQRNKVTYRGENGQKYENIKKLAVLLQEKHGE